MRDSKVLPAADIDAQTHGKREQLVTFYNQNREPILPFVHQARPWRQSSWNILSSSTSLIRPSTSLSRYSNSNAPAKLTGALMASTNGYSFGTDANDVSWTFLSFMDSSCLMLAALTNIRVEAELSSGSKLFPGFVQSVNGFVLLMSI